jgi:hypothetical protein
MDLIDKLTISYPDAKFSSVGDEITWSKENSYSKPTEDEINAKFQASQYQRDRAVAYDPLPEQLDQIYHDMDGWKAKIKAVKDKYPKPT